MTQESYVSAEAVAAYLNLHRRQVLALTRRGQLPAHAVDPIARRKRWRFKLTEVDAAISGNRPTLSRVPGHSDNALGSPRSQRG
jgi:excisionase family DNA binding protein